MSFILEVEGISGAGKTTLIPYIQKYLKKRELSSFTFYEPGFTKLGNDIRKLVLKEKDNGLYYKHLTNLLLFLTNRVDIRFTITNGMQKKDFTVIDRYYGSTYVYQILSLESEVERILLKNVLNATMGAITCNTSYSNKSFVDGTILLNASPDVALERVKKRTKKENKGKFKTEVRDDFEEYNTKKQMDYLDYFYMLDRNEKNILIDADQNLEKVVKDVEHKLDKLITSFSYKKKKN